MARVKFYDDTEELLVWNAVDLIIPEDSIEWAFYDSVEWYEEFLDVINDIVVVVDTDSFIQRDNIVDNYKEVIRKYIKSDLQDYFLSKIKVDAYKITVPFKVYIIINIKWCLKFSLDNLWYYKNLNTESVEEEFTNEHNNLLEEYTDFYTKLICRCTISTKYFFCTDIYQMLKEKFQYLENPQLWEWWTLHDHNIPQLREFLRALENYDNWKKVKMLWFAKKFIPEIVDAWAYKIVKDEYEPHHYTLDYIIFSLIFMRKAPLIVITRDFDNVELSVWYNVYLTDNETLIKKFINLWSNFIVVNPFQWIGNVVDEDTDEKWKNLIKEFREKYQEIYVENTSMDKKLDKCLDFMKLKLGEYEKIEFHITTKNHQPYSIIQIVTQCDPEKFHSTEESFSNPVTYESKMDEKWKKKRIYRSTKPLSEI